MIKKMSSRVGAYRGPKDRVAPYRGTSLDTHLLGAVAPRCVLLGMTIGLFLPCAAFAQALPDPICTFPGCGLPPGDILNIVALPELARIGLNSAAGLAVIFGMIGGARYLLSRGKEEETQKGFQTLIWSMGGMLLALASHRIVTAVLSQQYVAGRDPIFEFMNTVVAIMMVLLNVTFLLMILWGGIRMVTARGNEDEVTKGRKTVIYAVGGVILINIVPFIISSVIQINP